MHHWTRTLLALAAPLLLTGCLWGPGKFASQLSLHRDGSFTLDYRGEIVLQLPPDDSAEAKWSDDKAHCADGDTAGDLAGKPRPCTKAEITTQKKDYEQHAAEKSKEAEDMAKAFGLAGFDEASNRAFAAKLMKYAGWRSVAYRGNGVFDVDYHLVGSARQDFVFPALPDNNLIIPFIAIRRRADGSALVTAPALTGSLDPLGMAGKMGGGGKSDTQSRANGRFTVVTDGEILTNNSEDGPAQRGADRELHWDVGPASTKVPEALIRLQ